MTELEKKLGYVFRDKSILQTALTHSSYANETRSGTVQCNERLEFLGDSILGMTVAKYLYHNRPNMPEGKMTKLRAELVCEPSLVQIAEKLELGEHLYLGKGESLGGGRHRPSILADAVEAIFAAVLLDADMNRAEEIILRLLGESLEENHPTGTQDHKTALQELTQKKNGQNVTYHLLDATGPDHQKTFSVEVKLGDEIVGSGAGKSKKEAEQAAAAAALRYLRV